MRAPWLLLVLLLLAAAHARPGGRNGTAPARLVSAHHAHYSYHPPLHINYVCRYCSEPAQYPVYRGALPSYVYRYRESGSPLAALLAGLALYNLGRAAAERRAFRYAPRAGERCSMQFVDADRFEDVLIPCFMISSFAERPAAGADYIDISAAHVDVRQYTEAPARPPVAVSARQRCAVWHNGSAARERDAVPCGLLARYADTLRPAGLPVYVWLPVTVGTVIALSICCQFCCKSKKEYREDMPLSTTKVQEYSSRCPYP